MGLSSRMTEEVAGVKRQGADQDADAHLDIDATLLAEDTDSELVFAEFIEAICRVAIIKWQHLALPLQDKLKLAVHLIMGLERGIHAAQHSARVSLLARRSASGPHRALPTSAVGRGGAGLVLTVRSQARPADGRALEQAAEKTAVAHTRRQICDSSAAAKPRNTLY